MPEQLVQGWTEPIRQQLLNDGSPFDASGATLALVLRDKTGAVVSYTGTVAWSATATSVAQFSPAAGDLLAASSPYAARWKVTAAGKDAFYPNGEADSWTVRV